VGLVAIAPLEAGLLSRHCVLEVLRRNREAVAPLLECVPRPTVDAVTVSLIRRRRMWSRVRAADVVMGGSWYKDGCGTF
jgi:hypothetical protein